MTPRYYIQNDPPSVRRYAGDTQERWDVESKKWTASCAPEAACKATKDKLASEAEAQFFIKTRL